jgi:hypothetical protein
MQDPVASWWEIPEECFPALASPSVVNVSCWHGAVSPAVCPRHVSVGRDLVVLPLLLISSCFSWIFCLCLFQGSEHEAGRFCLAEMVFQLFKGFAKAL